MEGFYNQAFGDLGDQVSEAVKEKDLDESFKVFQGRLLKAYSAMKSEFGMIQINANQPIEKQQETVRQRLANTIELAQFELDQPT